MFLLYSFASILSQFFLGANPFLKYIIYLIYGWILFFSKLLINSNQIGGSLIGFNRISDSNIQTVDFIRTYGYPAEAHKVITADNYILTIYRIPYDGINKYKDRPVVLLQHGDGFSSDQWVFRGPSEDLVFLLSQQGYDIWMGNARGTIYSSHRIYSKDDPKFWNFSVDEMGNLDLPVIIDYILKTTGKPHLTYLGYSRGAASLLTLLSSQPQYNSKINLFLGIAPGIYFRETRSLFFRFAGNRPNALISTNKLRKVFEDAQIKRILYIPQSLKGLLNLFCTSGFLGNLCPSLVFSTIGDDYEMYNKTIISLMISQFTSGISAKEALHLIQSADSDIFRPYDYGRETNLLVYGSEVPQPYNLKNVLVPTYLYYGPNDFAMGEGDVLRLGSELPNFKGAYKVPFEKFNHIDYMFAKIANVLLYPNIISVINEYNNIN